jgi:hypothetical protein
MSPRASTRGHAEMSEYVLQHISHSERRNRYCSLSAAVGLTLAPCTAGARQAAMPTQNNNAIIPVTTAAGADSNPCIMLRKYRKTSVPPTTRVYTNVRVTSRKVAR